MESQEARHGADNGLRAAAISNEAVRVMREYTGRGPTKARTTIGRELVTILMADILTKGEHKLVESGKGERVLQIRHDFQMAMRDELIAAVETSVGRPVVAFMSSNHIDPDMAIEAFVLEPEAAA